MYFYKRVLILMGNFRIGNHCSTFFPVKKKKGGGERIHEKQKTKERIKDKEARCLLL